MKILMEIDPLSMIGSMVMMMAMISPSRRDISPEEQLCRSPRLVPPRFRLETAVLRPESFLIIFSREKDTLYQKMASGGFQVGHEAGGRVQGVGRAPTLVDSGWPPSGAFFAQYF